MDRQYIAIDLKSFYASVECVERELDPLTTNLVVADASRTEKTICLAVSPGLKKYGIPGRPRLFEVVQAVNGVNAMRKVMAPGKKLTGSSVFDNELTENPSLAVDYITAVPRMALYMSYSTKIYKIYLRYIAPEDIHVYSCDEVFMDVTAYLSTYKMTAHELALKMIREVLSETGITATAGIGTNLYLCKVAMDIVAKKMPADADVVRIAELNERTYRELLWDHKPLTDFWRVGGGTARKLEKMGLHTMGDVCAFSESCEDALYKVFGINAELLIDHAWGWEPCTMDMIKSFKPSTNSISTGQVLSRAYSYGETEIIVREMTELLSLDLVKKNVLTSQMVLTIGYESVKDVKELGDYDGEISMDRYGRLVPKSAHGSINLPEYTTQRSVIMDAVMELFKRIMNPSLMSRRIYVVACDLKTEENLPKDDGFEQLSLFSDYEVEEQRKQEHEERKKKEKALQEAELSIKQKYGKNAILKGTNFLEGATTIERNRQIGGHKA